MIRTRDQLYKILCEHTGKDMDTISKDCERDYWLHAEESVEYGVVDQLLEHIPDSMAQGHQSDED